MKLQAGKARFVWIQEDQINQYAPFALIIMHASHKGAFPLPVSMHSAVD